MKVDTRYVDDINLPRFAWYEERWKPFDSTGKFERLSSVSLDSNGVITSRQTLSGTGRKAIYLGYFLPIWGHCITDNLKKLWFLATPFGKDLISNGFELVCVVHKNMKLPENFKVLLQYLDIDLDRISVIDKEVFFGELVVPNDSLDSKHRYNMDFKQTVERICSQIPVWEKPIEKVYFSRSKFRSSHAGDFGEYRVEEVFRKLGYCIYHPETMSLSEQLEVLHNCKSFASTDGSSCHNAMFCQPGTECVVITKVPLIIPYQYSIMDMRDLQPVYIDAGRSLFKVFELWSGPFFMYANHNVIRFAKDRGLTIKYRFPFLTFAAYLINCIYQSFRYRRILKIIPETFYYIKWNRIR